MYDKKTAYAKYLKSNLCGDCAKGCDGCNDAPPCGDTPCDCCPPGLVSLRNAEDNHLGCVTLNDAQEYNTNVAPKCSDGNVALYKEGETPVFRGCVPADQFAALYAVLNPTG